MKSDFEVATYKESSFEIASFIKNNGTIFHDYNFLSALGEEWMCLAVINTANGEIAAALPLVKSKKFGLRSFHIPPFAHQFGPVLSKQYTHHAFEIISLLLSLLKREAHVDFKMFFPEEDALPFIDSGFTVSVTQTHIIKPSSDFGVDYIHSSKRRYLKKLIALLEEGKLVERHGSECLIDLLALYRRNALVAGFEPHLNQLERIFKALNKDQYFAHLIYTDKGEPLAGAFCPYDNNFAYHVINASIEHNDKLLNKANTLSTYLAIKKALSMNRGFDFEGSNISGVAFFYRMMGGEPKIVYRAQKTRSLFFHILRAFKSIKKEKL